jgi:hypothetical protein
VLQRNTSGLGALQIRAPLLLRGGGIGIDVKHAGGGSGGAMVLRSRQAEQPHRSAPVCRSTALSALRSRSSSGVFRGRPALGDKLPMINSFDMRRKGSIPYALDDRLMLRRQAGPARVGLMCQRSLPWLGRPGQFDQSCAEGAPASARQSSAQLFKPPRPVVRSLPSARSLLLRSPSILRRVLPWLLRYAQSGRCVSVATQQPLAAGASRRLFGLGSRAR